MLQSLAHFVSRCCSVFISVLLCFLFFLRDCLSFFSSSFSHRFLTTNGGSFFFACENEYCFNYKHLAGFAFAIYFIHSRSRYLNKIRKQKCKIPFRYKFLDNALGPGVKFSFDSLLFVQPPRRSVRRKVISHYGHFFRIS